MEQIVMLMVLLTGSHLTSVLGTVARPGWRTSTTICFRLRSRFVMNLRVRTVICPFSAMFLIYQKFLLLFYIWKVMASHKCIMGMFWTRLMEMEFFSNKLIVNTFARYKNERCPKQLEVYPSISSFKSTYHAWSNTNIKRTKKTLLMALSVPVLGI